MFYQLRSATPSIDNVKTHLCTTLLRHPKSSLLSRKTLSSRSTDSSFEVSGNRLAFCAGFFSYSFCAGDCLFIAEGVVFEGFALLVAYFGEFCHFVGHEVELVCELDAGCCRFIP